MRNGKTLLLGSVCVLLAIFRAPAAKADGVDSAGVAGPSAAAVVIFVPRASIPAGQYPPSGGNAWVIVQAPRCV